ncbi:MAG: cation-transporting P-type ATPase, partial [Thermomicrobiales bacterium]
MSGKASDEIVHEPYRRTADEVVAALHTDARSGLNASEVKQRHARFGRNELNAAAPRPEWLKFIDQFTNILVVLLIVAAAISIAIWLHERDTALPYEAIAIFAIVILNALMGYFQEARAERAAAAGRGRSAARSYGIGDGE